MPKLQTTTRQVTPSGGLNVQRVSGADLGADQGLIQTGKELTDLSARLQQVENAKRTRLDTINRIRAKGQYDQMVREQRTRIESEEDITDPGIADSFGQFLAERRDELVSNWQGSDQGRLNLMEDLEELRFKYASDAAKTFRSAQDAVVEQEVGTRIRRNADAAGDAPDLLEELLEQVDRDVQDVAPARTPAQSHEDRLKGRSEVYQSAIKSYLTSKNYTAAREILNTSGAAEALSADTMRTLRTTAIKQEYADGEIHRKNLEKIQSARRILGSRYTPEMDTEILGIDTKDTPEQVIAKLNSAALKHTGQGLTPSQVHQALGTYVSDSDEFGRDNLGRALAKMDELAPVVFAGAASPEQRATFETAYNIASATRTTTDALGNKVDVRVPLSRHHKEAAGALGLETRDRGPAVVPASEGGGQMPPAPPGAPGSFDVPFEESLFGMALEGDVAGLSSGIRAGVGGLPIIGDVFGNVETDKAIQARRRAANISKDYITALQNNSRLPEGEREAMIEDGLGIGPETFTSERAYLNGLVAADKELDAKIQTAFKKQNDPALTVRAKAGYAELMATLTAFKRRLQVPPQVKSRSEAMKLPPGTLFVTPDFQLGMTPPSAGGE